MAAPTLDELRAWVGGDAPPSQDPVVTARLTEALAAATEHVEGRVLPSWVDGTDPYPASVHTAILIEAHAVYDRASSPNGVAGFDALGNLYRVTGKDPDVERLLSPYLAATAFT